MERIKFSLIDNTGKNTIFVDTNPEQTYELHTREVTMNVDGGQLNLAVSGDSDFAKSNKLFTKSAKIFAMVIVPTIKKFSERFTSQSHTIKSIQAHMMQKIEGLLGNDMYSSHDNHASKLASAVAKIKENPELAAETIVFIQKRVIELDAHISSFELIHMGNKIKLDVREHNFPKVIRNVLSSFDDKFNTIGVTYNFAFDQEVGDEFYSFFDYKTINTALYNIFDNAFKYIMPHSEIRLFISDRKIIFSMRSLRIEREEIDKIYQLGYRGVNSQETDGSGVGMYVIKKALEINNMSIRVESDLSDQQAYNNQYYVMNKFIISA
jgi:K+-sensing histidine kinase KdpD